MKASKGNTRCLLLGITGGIATGKTTVSCMLEELGAPLIDFDLLARRVVKPGTHALEKITTCFGKRVLAENGTLDRKRLSKIIFSNIKKRKKLESITHPPIFKEYKRQVESLDATALHGIIQVSMPLLIEGNAQFMFHKILVVYIPREEQVKRLARRDNISIRAAAEILKSQLPIDEKIPWADFIINNEHSLEETRSQVEKTWDLLKKARR